MGRQKGDPQTGPARQTSRGQHQGVGVGEVGVGPGREQPEPQQQRLGASWGHRAGAGAEAAALAQGWREAQWERSGWPRSGRVPRLERVRAWVANSNSSHSGPGAGGLAAGGAGSWRPGPRAGLSSAPLSSPQPPSRGPQASPPGGQLVEERGAGSARRSSQGSGEPETWRKGRHWTSGAAGRWGGGGGSLGRPRRP